jgi:hypothetical protein
VVAVVSTARAVRRPTVTSAGAAIRIRMMLL